MRWSAWIAVVASVLIANVASANDIQVDTTTDEVNADGDCSLREAVQAANGNVAVDQCTAGSAGSDRVLIPVGVYNLTLGSISDDDANAGGDLDLTESATLIGAGADLVRIVLGHAQGNVIEVVNTGTYEIRGVTLTGMGGSTNGASAAISVSANGPVLSVVECTIERVAGRLNGGGIHTYGASLTLERSLLDSVGDYAIWWIAGSLTVRNTTIHGTAGGAIMLDSTGVLTVEQTTFSDNLVVLQFDGFLFGREPPPTFISDSVFAGAGMSIAGITTGDYTSGGGNVVQDGQPGWGPNDLINTDPQLGALQDNGGPTRTRLPVATSPAIGRSDCMGVTLDQRGFNRPTASCTSGAVEFNTAVCGNMAVESGEACDDGNLVDGDGCDNNCTSSACGNAVAAGGEVCDDGNAIDGDGCDSNCTLSACGNDVAAPLEACDDGNLTNGDGCDVNCTISACGNAIMDPSEACDDGNLIDGDACESNCTLPVCGNGITSGTEICDDDNDVNGDGCDSNCTATACGNGVVSEGELCDDGNILAADGCSASCLVETTLLRTARFEDAQGQCPAGGVSIASGFDLDGDAQLSDGEVETTERICDADGVSSGEPGADGPQGAEGEPGAEASNGVGVLSRLTPIPRGERECTEGGVLLETGRDDDRDGQLSDGEVDRDEAICNVVPGGTSASPLIDVESIAAGGDRCADGGVNVRIGLDDGAGAHAGNAKLDDDEVDTERPVCLSRTQVFARSGDEGGSCTVQVAGAPGSNAAGWTLGLLLVATAVRRRRRLR